jgi:hypothetical protein
MAGRTRSPDFGRWHSMATAPQDGTPVLLFTQWREWVIGHWSPERGIWIDASHGMVVAVRWMPLPDPPAMEVEDETEFPCSSDRLSSYPGILVAG